MSPSEHIDRIQYLAEQIQERATGEANSPSADNRFLLRYEAERLVKELSYPFRALSHQLKPEANGDYNLSVREMMNQVDRCSYHRLCLALCGAGAVWPCFYQDRWPTPFSVVMENLANIEELPPDTEDLDEQAAWIRATRKQFGITADPNTEAS